MEILHPFHSNFQTTVRISLIKRPHNIDYNYKKIFIKKGDFNKMNLIQAYLIMFLTGGFLYCGIEILYRGYSHISMLFAGGLCFILVGVIQNILGESASIVGQMLLCGIMITGVEFLFGEVVNKYMHLNVWDYSAEQYNFKGQICLLYSNMWFLLSCPMIILHDYMEYILIGSHMPHYKIF